MVRLRFPLFLVCGAVLAAATFVLRCAPLPKYGGESRQPAKPAAETRTRAPGDTSRAQQPVYRLEDELPEKTPAREAPLVERIAPMAPDTFAVQDVVVEPEQKQLYSVGYRVQVFASSDRAAAESMRQRVVAEAKLAAYIDFEDGLYKVRAGDFVERKDALQSKLSLEKMFPGCWIVRTTIRAE